MGDMTEFGKITSEVKICRDIYGFTSDQTKQYLEERFGKEFVDRMYNPEPVKMYQIEGFKAEKVPDLDFTIGEVRYVDETDKQLVDRARERIKHDFESTTKHDWDKAFSKVGKVSYNVLPVTCIQVVESLQDKAAYCGFKTVEDYQREMGK